MLEGGEFKTLRPDERCVLWLELLCGQVCIVQGEIEAARQLLTDGFATSQQTFGTGDVLTIEFQTALAEVYIERREIKLAISYLNIELAFSYIEFELAGAEIGKRDICEITALTLAAKVFCISGLFNDANSLFLECLKQARSIVGDNHSIVLRILYVKIEIELRQEDYATAEKLLRGLRNVITIDHGPEHLEVLQITLQLAYVKLRMGESGEAGQICQALLVQQQERHTDTHDLITLTKAVLWLSDLHSGKTDSEGDLENDLLKSLENESRPNPKLARRWETVALLAEEFGAVDVANALKKHCDKAMELAFGVEYLQAMEKKRVSPEDSNNE